MTSVLEALLGLDDIRLGRDAPLVLEWHGRVEAWILFCFALAMLTWVIICYRRERIALRRRVALGALRCTLFALVAVVLCEPVLVLQQNRTEQSHVALMVDTSRSMATQDFFTDVAYRTSMRLGAQIEDGDSLEEYSRLSLSIRALLSDDSAPLRTLLERNAIRLYSFANAPQFEGTIAGGTALEDGRRRLESLIADGTASDPARAILHAIQDARGRRLAAIVLVTDGQATDSTKVEEAVDLARGRQIPIFALRVGSSVTPPDVWVGPLRASEQVFVNDVIAIEAPVSAVGIEQPTTLIVRLLDDHTGRTLVEERVTVGGAVASVTVELRAKPTRVGAIRYRVEVDPLPGERNVENNSDVVDVVALDEHMSVLFVDGYPRYEYRYLKNALAREDTIRLSVLLLEADERFVQEGTEPIRRFPETREELDRYDVILFGDVDPRGGWLSARQMRMIVDFVGDSGGGFGLIAGERSAPHRFLGTPLEKLIPVRIDPEFLGHYRSTIVSGYRPKLTLEGTHSRIFRFSEDRALSEAMFDALPELYWVARTLGPKPGAVVLAEHPTITTVAGPLPLMTLGRYGAGKVFFQATDDTWLWRRHTGELLHDAYWVLVARELMQPDRITRDRRYTIRTDQRVYSYGAPVEVQVEVFDAELLATQGQEVSIVAVDARDAVVVQFAVRRLGEEANVFEGSFVPPRAGGFRVKTRDIATKLGESRPSAPFQVRHASLEARHPEANHDLLVRFAEATGGGVIEPDRLASELRRVQDRSRRIPDDITEPLWDSRLVLALFVLIITMEWILRKAYGLL